MQAGRQAGITVSLAACGSIPGRGNIFLSIPQCSDRLWNSPDSINLMGTVVSSLGMRWLGREADHSQSSAEVKNSRTITPLPTYLHGMVPN
jgi:hypothetical protein